jgi:hypothetical protein
LKKKIPALPKASFHKRLMYVNTQMQWVTRMAQVERTMRLVLRQSASTINGESGGPLEKNVGYALVSLVEVSPYLFLQICIEYMSGNDIQCGAPSF